MCLCCPVRWNAWFAGECFVVLTELISCEPPKLKIFLFMQMKLGARRFFLINKPAKLSDYKTFLIRCNAMFAKRNSSARTWGNVDALEFSFPCSRLHERVGREAFRVSPANWRGSPRSDEIFKSEKWICPFSDLVKVLNVDLEIILKLENSLKKMHSEICPWQASHVVLVTLQKKKSRAKRKKIFRRNWRAS